MAYCTRYDIFSQMDTQEIMRDSYFVNFAHRFQEAMAFFDYTWFGSSDTPTLEEITAMIANLLKSTDDYFEEKIDGTNMLECHESYSTSCGRITLVADVDYCSQSEQLYITIELLFDVVDIDQTYLPGVVEDGVEFDIELGDDPVDEVGDGD